MSKRLRPPAILGLTILTIATLTACGSENATNSPIAQTESDYVVLLGEGPENQEKFPTSEVLVIDGEYFTSEDISAIKSNGTSKIYSYLNVGSIEEFRDYYKEYEDLTLGDYEDWPEEHWIDVSDARWQESLLERAQALKDIGIDGYFIDNTDVYYQYPQESIYEGLVAILTQLHDMDMTIIINGGDEFVSRYLEEGNSPIFEGINQENIYTNYDFDLEEYGIQAEEDRVYFTDYCQKVQNAGLEVYCLEYADCEAVSEMAYSYSAEHGFTCYVADNIGLNLNQQN